MTHRAPYVFALFAAAGCGIDVPEDPTWTEHVRPILAANCIRCHGMPATGGAPDSFRLDSYEDTFGLDGRHVRGAALMARFIAVRAGDMGEMPPDYPRTDGQRDILINWWARADELGPLVCQERDDLGFRFCPELGGSRPSRAPDAVALDLPATADTDLVTVRYEITDADGDLVNGVLNVGDVAVSTDLRDGRGAVTFDPSSLPTGPNEVVAVLNDDIEIVNITLGAIQIDHASGNTAPRARFVAPERYALITDLDLPFEVEVHVTDIDPPSPQTLALIAFRGAEEIGIVEGLPINAAGEAFFLWDTTAPLIPAGSDGANWRLRAVVDDDSVTGVGESGTFTVSHNSTTLTFDDVSGIIGSRCTDCHGGLAEVPQLFSTHSSVRSAAGIIYRRVIQQRTMPPPSAAGAITGFELMTDAERATVAEYLLGGATP